MEAETSLSFDLDHCSLLTNLVSYLETNKLQCRGEIFSRYVILTKYLGYFDEKNTLEIEQA